MLGHLRSAILLSGLIALNGCHGDGDAAASNKSTADAPTDTELAAYSASHPYPATRPSQEIKLAAIANPDRTSIKIYNFSNQPFSDADVWVNAGWVQHVRGITANGSVVVESKNLYNAFGKNFAGQKEPVSRVQLKTSQGFYDVMGPVAQ